MTMNIFKEHSLLTHAIANAYLSSIDPKRPSLRETIHTLQTAPSNGFFADLLLQHKFGYEQVDQSFEAVANEMNMDAQLVTNMNDSRVYQREWKPFTHQIESWTHLMDEDNRYSVIISSGTGSGKTECFMVPMFNDFAHQLEDQVDPNSPLTGVQALMIYPLNALSESQKDRLDGYLRGFDGRIKYAQYNGDTLRKHNQESKQNETPHQQQIREQIRENPPSILLTNTTMLELILKRTKDQPILKQSQGKLKYIVLDEAHTYLGSSAADLSLLLRRVLIAFGVEASKVHFIATSATISSADQDKAREELTQLLASISGQEASQIKVVFGHPDAPTLNTPMQSWSVSKLAIDDLDVNDPEYRHTLYKVLANTKESVYVRSKILEGERTYPELCAIIKKVYPKLTEEDLQSILLYGLKAFDPELQEFFCPLRAHMFERTQGQLWACSNHQCSGLQNQSRLQADPQWFFGPLFVQYTQTCPHCDSHTYEVTFCSSCGQDYIQGECNNSDEADRAFTPGQPTLVESWNSDQEFEREGLDQDIPDEDSSGEHNQTRQTFVLTRSSDVFNAGSMTENEIQGLEEYRKITFGRFDHKTRIFSTYADIDDTFLDQNPLVWVPTLREIENEKPQSYCPCCQNSKRNSNQFWSTRRGQKYSIRVNLPLFLKCLPSSNFAKDKSPIGDGKQLLSFTDSRAGTANYAMTIQSDIERTWVRSFILHRTVELCNQNNLMQVPVKTIVDNLSINPNVRAIDEFKRTFIGTAYTYAFPNQDWDALAKILFMTFMTRNGQSPEKTGLLEFVYMPVEQLNAAPSFWTDKFVNDPDESLPQWKNFITIFIDLFLRKNQILNLNGISETPIRQRMVFDGNVRHKRLDVTHPDVNSHSKQKTPSWQRTDDNGAPQQIFNPSKIVQILITAFGLEYEKSEDVQFVKKTIKAVVQLLKGSRLLTPVSPGDPSLGYAFNLFADGVCLQPMEGGFFCQTKRTFMNRVLTINGISYSSEFPKGPHATYVTLPAKITNPFPTAEEGVEIEYNLFHNPEVTEARFKGYWSSLTDKLVAYTPYIQTAEHSAGLSTQERREIEQWFRDGKLNVLFCSTTMEMGVDIGGLHGVINSNLPPMSSNYLQRIGRAGRRGEGLALSLTICKNMPHDKMAFYNPHWPFTQEILVTDVKLDSKAIVQRHCNAFLLGEYFKTIPEPDQTSVQWFFFNGGDPNPPVEGFIQYLENCPTDVIDFLKQIIRGSILEEQMIFDILEETQRQIKQIRQRFKDSQVYFEGHLNTLAGNIQWKGAMFPRITFYDAIALSPDLENQMLPLLEQQPSYRPNPDGILTNPEEIAVKSQYRLFLQTQLSSYLGEEGFLSGSMHVRGLVSFDYRNVDELKKARSTDSIPTRPLPIAIREYAPGADIVRQNKVYRSAGVLLKWHQPPNLNDNTVEEIKRYCTRCLGTQHTKQKDDTWTCNTCEHTGSIKTFIPNTFCVDLRTKPSLQLTNPIYLSSESPLVSMTGDWLYFHGFEYRTSQEAKILHYSRGVHGHGYALCLYCGRTAAEVLPPIDGELGDLPSELVNHRRLRGGKNPNGKTDQCQANNDSLHAIQRYIKLGGTTHTHGFELRIPNEDDTPCTNKVALTSIGFAMKTALAQMVGVENAELGVHIQASSIVIHDMNDGGAGFSIQAPRELALLIDRTIAILECQNNNCASACEECLINYGTQYSIEDLNRHTALEVLNAAKNKIIDLKQLFLQGVAEPKAITQRWLWMEFTRQAKMFVDTPPTMRLYLHGQTEDELDWFAWSFKRTLQQFSQHKIQLVFDQGLLGILQDPKSPMYERVYKNILAYIQLANAERTDETKITLHSANLPDIGNTLAEGEFYVWGELVQGNRVVRFASTDDQLIQAHAEWLDTNMYGSAEEAGTYYHFYYIGEQQQPYYAIEAVDLNQVPVPENQHPFNSLSLEIKPQTRNCIAINSVRDSLFGLNDPSLTDLLQMITGLVNQYGTATTLSYNDRYLVTPLKGTVLYYTFQYFKSIGLVDENTSCKVSTLPPKSDTHSYHGHQYNKNWHSAQSQREFLEGISDHCFKNSTIDIVQRRGQKIPHARYFTFVWTSKTTVVTLKLFIDQGLDIFGMERPYLTIHSFEEIKGDLKVHQHNPVLVTATVTEE